MRPVPRIVAVCQGGELDGLRFSVALSDDGEPQPFTVHGRDGELTYRPAQQLELAEAHAASVEVQRRIATQRIPRSRLVRTLVRVRRRQLRPWALEQHKHPVFHGFELHLPELREEHGIVRGHHFHGVWIYREGAR
jgi:hypothetical protein